MNRSQLRGDLPEPVNRYFDEVALMQLPNDLLDAAIVEIERSPHVNRFSPMGSVGLAAAAVIGVLAVAGIAASYAFGPDPNFGSGPSPSLAEQTPAPTPTASMLPARGMPGTRRPSLAGEYGWTGELLGSKTGMHSVIGNESSPDEFRQTQLIFAVENDCFPAAPGAKPTAKTVAGLDGLYLEPYDGPGVLFIAPPRGGETTAAYALPIGDRTLCAYLTWDAATTPDELNAAREVLESIRGQSFGEDGIRINFTLPAGWDTG